MPDLQPRLGCRRFLVTDEDQLYRLANTTFDRMLHDPAPHPLLVFAGHRVRMADLVIEQVDRKPVRVIRETYSILAFDDQGRLDTSAFGKQQNALVDQVVTSVLMPTRNQANVIDASARFLAQGGTWTPSRSLTRTLHEAALGQKTCPRI